MFDLFQQPVLDYVRKNMDESNTLLQGQFPDQMKIMMNAYDKAIKIGTITKERNPGLYQLAEECLKSVKK